MGIFDPFAGLRETINQATTKSLAGKDIHEGRQGRIDAQALANAITGATQNPYNQPGETKKTSTKETQKRRETENAKMSVAMDEETNATIDARWAQNPIVQKQADSIRQLREKIVMFAKTPAADLSGLMQWGDFMTGGHYNLSETYKPEMTQKEKIKLLNDMENTFNKSVNDLHDSYTNYLNAQSKSYLQTGTLNENVNVSSKSYEWRTASDKFGKRLGSTQVADVAAYDESEELIKNLQNDFNELVQLQSNPLKMWIDYDTYQQRRMIAAQNIGKALEGKMTDEDFKRIVRMMPSAKEKIYGNADAKFHALFRYIESKRDAFARALEANNQWMPPKGQKVYWSPTGRNSGAVTEEWAQDENGVFHPKTSYQNAPQSWVSKRKVVAPTITAPGGTPAPAAPKSKKSRRRKDLY